MSQSAIQEIDTTKRDSSKVEDDPVDMINRDPNNLNDHVKLLFEDVMGEPEGSHSDDCVWSNSYFCFRSSRNCCYRVLAFVCGIPLMVCWGFQFAIITFSHVWYITPCVKCYTIQCDCMTKFYHTCLECSMKPLYDMMGAALSNLRVAGM